jgi:hypothetical protein
MQTFINAGHALVLKGSMHYMQGRSHLKDHRIVIASTHLKDSSIENEKEIN